MIVKLWPSDDGTRMRQGQKVVVVGPVPVFEAGEVVEDAERRERAHPEVIIEVRDGNIVVWGGVSFWPSLMRSLNRRVPPACRLRRHHGVSEATVMSRSSSRKIVGHLHGGR